MLQYATQNTLHIQRSVHLQPVVRSLLAGHGKSKKEKKPFVAGLWKVSTISKCGPQQSAREVDIYS